MQIPTSYSDLKNYHLLSSESERLDRTCVWFEGVRWLTSLGPEISIPGNSHMVPFAISAYGDWWCWEFANGLKRSTAVILSPPDTGDCTYYAFSHESFMFRRILRFLSNDVFTTEPDPDGIRFTIEEAHEQILIWIDQLGVFFDKPWLTVLQEMSKSTKFVTHVHSSKFKYDCLLSPHRQIEIERTMFAYDLLDKTFKFDRLEIDWFGE
jgi:hypothetical protein